MTLDQLEALADEGGLYAEVNPATIKQLIALCRQQHSTLMLLNSPNAQDRHTAITAFADAIAAYKQFDKGAM